jgi:hypothetical protein
MEFIDVLNPEISEYNCLTGISFEQGDTHALFIQGKYITDYKIVEGDGSITIPYFSGFCDVIQTLERYDGYYNIEISRTNSNINTSITRAGARFCTAIFNLRDIKLIFAIQNLTCIERK